MKKLTLEELQNWRRYHTPGCSNLHTLKVDVIHLSKANSVEHELAKCKFAIMVSKGERHFITEAERNKLDEHGKKRRVDLVDITEGIEYEFETDPKRAVRFVNDKKVYIVPVGWSKEDEVWKKLEKMHKIQMGRLVMGNSNS